MSLGHKKSHITIETLKAISILAGEMNICVFHKVQRWKRRRPGKDQAPRAFQILRWWRWEHWDFWKINVWIVFMMVSNFFSIIFFPVSKTRNYTFQNGWSVRLMSAGHHSQVKQNWTYYLRKLVNQIIRLFFQLWKKTSIETWEFHTLKNQIFQYPVVVSQHKALK